MIGDLFFWAVIPVAVAVFWSLPSSQRYRFLALVSFGIVFTYDPISGACLGALATTLFLSLPKIAVGDRKASFLLAFWILAPALFIVCFKAQPLLAIARGNATGVAETLIPLGASYYTFKMIHVAVNTYRRREFSTPADIFFSYLFLFTAFVAGPIQRLELFESGRTTRLIPDDVFSAVTRIAVGILKTVFLVAQVSSWRRELTEHGNITIDMLAGAPPVTIWIVLICAYLTAYLNLAGYTDIAIGASRLFGIKIQENFNWPIFARNLADYWRRWHMTLSGWCQDYIYMTVLAWLRNPYIALLCSFQVMGLWHMFSFNRVAWGLFHAGGVAVFMLWSRRARHWRINPRLTFLPAWLATQIFVTLSFIFVFNEESNDPWASITIILRAFGSAAAAS